MVSAVGQRLRRDRVNPGRLGQGGGREALHQVWENDGPRQKQVGGMEMSGFSVKLRATTKKA